MIKFYWDGCACSAKFKSNYIHIGSKESCKRQYCVAIFSQQDVQRDVVVVESWTQFPGHTTIGQRISPTTSVRFSWQVNSTTWNSSGTDHDKVHGIESIASLELSPTTFSNADNSLT